MRGDRKLLRHLLVMQERERESQLRLMLDDLHAEREGLQELFGSFENALRKIVAGIRPSAALAEIDRNPADIKARIPHIGEDHCVAAHDLQSANVQVSSARPLQWHEFYRKKFRRTSIFHLFDPAFGDIERPVGTTLPQEVQWSNYLHDKRAV
jgi:hypothetical protein